MINEPGFFDDYDENQEPQTNQKSIWDKDEVRKIKSINHLHPDLQAVFDKQSQKNSQNTKRHLYLIQQYYLYYCKTFSGLSLSGCLNLLVTRVEFSEIRSVKEGHQTTTFCITFKRNQKQLVLQTQNRETYTQWSELLALRAIKTTFHDDFMIQKQIGKGTYAKVFLATKKQNKLDYAIKVYSKDYIANINHGRESLQNEIEILRQIDSNCSYLIHLYEVYETKNSIYLVLDLLSGGELLTKLQEKKENLKATELRRIMLNLLMALDHLHSKNIGHRDIKLENLIFQNQTDDSIIILADLGLATSFDKDPSKICYKRCGTPGYIAPEILNYKPENKTFYNIKCDIFSAGVIFYILLSGKQAFVGSDYKQILQKNKECLIDFEQKDLHNISSRAKDLLKRMLNANPQYRFTAAQCLKHEFFNADKKSDSLVTSQQQREYNYQQFIKTRKRSSDQQSQIGSLALKDCVSGLNGKVDTYVQSINDQNSQQEIDNVGSPLNEKKNSLFQQDQPNNQRNKFKKSQSMKSKHHSLHMKAIQNNMNKNQGIEEFKSDQQNDDEEFIDNEYLFIDESLKLMQFNILMKHPPSKSIKHLQFYSNKQQQD